MNEPAPLRETLHGRCEYVELLAGDPRQKRDIVDAVDAARSTVDRDVRLLCDAGIIERTANGYRTTAAGRLAADVHNRHDSALTDVSDASPLLESIPAYAPVSRDFVVGSTVVEPSAVAPDSALSALLDIVGEATAIRGASPVVLQPYVDLAEESVATSTPTELVLSTGVVERLVVDHGAALDAAVGDDTTTIYECDSVPYGIVLASTDDGHRGAVVVYDDGGVKGLLRNDDPDAIQWLRDQFERLRAQSARRG